MNVTSIGLENFMVHKCTQLVLPSSGVVLVTGANGAGKSSVIEAVSVALWGKSLRGTDPWTEGKVSMVRVWCTDGTIVERKRVKSRSSVEFTSPLIPRAEYDTASKAQAALESVIGEWDVWRRTSVFSSADASHFTLASDGERKELLETLLCLHIFQRAYDLCRADVSLTRSELSILSTRKAVLIERVAAARRAVEQASFPEDAIESPVDAEEERTLQRWYEETNQELADVASRLRQASRARGTADAKLNETLRRLHVVQSGVCPTCEQTIPAAMVGRIRDEVESLNAAKQDPNHAEATLIKAEAELRAELRLVTDRRRQYDDRKVQFEGVQRVMENARRAREAALVNLEKADKELHSITTSHNDYERNLEVLKSVADVLGLQGVRAHVLGGTLTGIERVANVWLSRIAGARLSLKLTSYTENKSGSVSDKIGLEIVGAGNGRGYRAASQGERKRIDIALLIALSTVASAASGRPPGTLFFDEVFDGLDVEGTASVASALAELARDRAVVVVSHSDALAQTIAPRVRWNVDAGRVRVEE